ncbi:hypothetical protein A3I50_01745 [Candidatus Roizmanbacteria bacterium RIFCSPLOWO2_02_FULL_37_9]|nr:MAG: hypothetical protein A3I50_01745 [Candidatus Roizmanbacteria bacterium RIFCSPLOWO2_02_FULL_37_9]
MFKVEFSEHSLSDLKKLPKDIQKRIIKKIQFYSSQKDIIAFSKPLVDIPPSTHRFRVGNYRIAFHSDKQTVFIDRIRHRKEVYL